jgi:putative Mg2+ transporter-C (MgtC) family protein
MKEMIDLIQGWSTMAVFLRLLLAMVVGIVIGMEREIRNRGAGIKTHVLVCIGAALAMIVSEYVMWHFPGARADMNRFGAAVIGGVGFLGVGTIVVTGRNEIRGLTTAAGLWACAITGLCAGIGYVQGTLIALAFILFTFAVLSRIDVKLHRYSRELMVYIEFTGNEGVKEFLREMHAKRVKIRSCSLNKIEKEDTGMSAVAVMELPEHSMSDEVIEYIASADGIRYFDQM